MITPMIKYHCLVYHQDFLPFLYKLQMFGLVDVEQNTSELAANEKRILDLMSKYQDVIRFLSERKVTSTHLPTITSLSPIYVFDQVRILICEKEQTILDLKQQKQLYETIRHFGNYDLSLIQKLQNRGLSLTFFITTVSNYKKIAPTFPDELTVEVLHDSGSFVYFVAISQDKTSLQIDATEIKLPELSLQELEQQILLKEHNLQRIENLFDEYSIYLDLLQNEKSKLKDLFDFEHIKDVTTKVVGEKVCMITGYIPEGKDVALNAMLEGEGIFYVCAPAMDTDNAPVLLKNNKFASLFEVITKLFSLPAYCELDLTPFFAPFFMLFFGFCFGDAGYGVLTLLVATLFKKKLKPEMRPLASLAQWLGFATIIFGTLSGSFFGLSLVEIPIFSRVKHLFFTQDNMMVLALALGAVQMIFGMCVNVANIIKKRGFKYAIGNIGWIIVILGMAAAIGLPSLGYALSPFILYTCYASAGIGGLAAFFYNSPEKNIFVNFGSGIWNAYNVATGLLGDLLSYIRLFALGLTGGILGSVFNTLAVDMSGDTPVVSQITMILILLIGHSLNIALSALGALVHPLRLTFVEFYKNAGFEGNGRAYAPFKIHHKE